MLTKKPAATFLYHCEVDTTTTTLPDKLYHLDFSKVTAFVPKNALIAELVRAKPRSQFKMAAREVVWELSEDLPIQISQ